MKEMREKTRAGLARMDAESSPTGETAPVVEHFLIDGFAACGTRCASRGTRHESGEDGASDAAARGAERATDQAGRCTCFRAGQRKSDGTRRACGRANRTANASRGVTWFRTWRLAKRTLTNRTRTRTVISRFSGTRL
jgi:hypothetical protein